MVPRMLSLVFVCLVAAGASNDPGAPTVLLHRKAGGGFRAIPSTLRYNVRSLYSLVFFMLAFSCCRPLFMLPQHDAQQAYKPHVGRKELSSHLVRSQRPSLRLSPNSARSLPFAQLH